VISKTSGHVFERRLIEKSLEASKGVCPVTGNELSVSDLLPVEANLAVRPRPLTATSLPGMLAMFQNEWDDVMLETHVIKQQLHATRKELSHALYQHDAACRVIARLVNERDEAQRLVAELQRSLAGKLTSEISSNRPNISKGELDPEVITRLTDFWKKTSRSRKKRPVSRKLSPAETIIGWSKKTSMELFDSNSGATDVAICQLSGAIVCAGGKSGVAWLAAASAPAATSKDCVADTCSIVPGSASSPGTVFVTSGGDKITLWKANEEDLSTLASVKVPGAASVAAHPTGSYAAIISSNASWGLVAFGAEMSTLCELSRVMPDNPSEAPSAPLKFHPDGLILATPTTSSQGHIVRIWDVKEQKSVHSFEGHAAPISCVAFSENGYYMASSSTDTTVKIWDLRKLTEFKTINNCDGVTALAFDRSGKYLAHASATRIQINVVKEWSTLSDLEVNGQIRALDFGIDAEFVAAASSNGYLDFFGSRN